MITMKELEDKLAGAMPLPPLWVCKATIAALANVAGNTAEIYKDSDKDLRAAMVSGMAAGAGAALWEVWDLLRIMPDAGLTHDDMEEMTRILVSEAVGAALGEGGEDDEKD